MPTVDIREGMNIEDTVAKLKKTLTYLLESLDHFNVKRLYTEYCKIQSEEGETEISGPLLLMKDKQATPVLRLKMGYDADSSDFVFELYDPSGNKTVYLDSNGTEVLDGKLLLTASGKTLLEAYKDTNGGKVVVYDINGNTNVRIGSEGTGGANVGGVMVLFNDSAAKPRVAMGINAATDSGAIEALDTNGTIRTYMSGEQSGGEAGFIVYDSSGAAKSYIFETTGYINNKKIATEEFVTGQGYITGTSGATGNFTTADGKTVTVTDGLITSIA
jgi:hypothetical protein